VGILPPRLKYPGLRLTLPSSGADVWIPPVPAPAEQNRSFANIRAVARLKQGITIAQAQAEMNVLALQLEQQYPDSNTNVGAEVGSLHEHLTGQVRRGLWILLGAVGCVLLIACANVANLLLARSAVRQTEMAVRAALGANRWRLIRQLLVECLALSVTGGICGALLAALGVPLLIGLSATSIPRADEIGVSPPVLGFTLLVSLSTGVIFGLAPALQSSRIQLVETLKEGKKGAAGRHSEAGGWRRRKAGGHRHYSRGYAGGGDDAINVGFVIWRRCDRSVDVRPYRIVVCACGVAGFLFARAASSADGTPDRFALRLKNTFLASKFRRLTTRLGKKRALVAVGHSILICYKTGFTETSIVQFHALLTRRKHSSACLPKA
jgi:hypothetical protein